MNRTTNIVTVCPESASPYSMPRTNAAVGFREPSFALVSLLRLADENGDGWLASDSHCNPVDEVGFRIEFAAWRGGPPGHEGQASQPSKFGHGAVQVARRRALSNWPDTTLAREVLASVPGRDEGCALRSPSPGFVIGLARKRFPTEAVQPI
jgi:hypothetical protein